MLNRRVFAISGALLIGTLIGSGATYFAMRRPDPVVAAVPKPDPPVPSDADAHALFVELLQQAGIDAKVHRFTRTGWEQFDAKVHASGHKAYCTSYEAEIEFAEEGQIRQNFTFAWGPNSYAKDSTASISGNRLTQTFRPGERLTPIGLLTWVLVDGKWVVKPVNEYSEATAIDAGK